MRMMDSPPRSVVERACIDDRLGLAVGAQHDEQVGDYGRLALVGELDDLPLGQALECALDHAGVS